MDQELPLASTANTRCLKAAKEQNAAKKNTVIGYDLFTSLSHV